MAEKGTVTIGNQAFKEDKGKGVVRIWLNPKNEYFGIEYSLPGFGFGGASFKVVDAKASGEGEVPVGRLKVDDSEMMSRQFIKDMFCRLVDEAEWDHDEKTI